MSKPKQEPELTGPWRKLHGAIWVIGLAILFWQGWWWPGILVLVGVSMLLEAVLMRYAPQAFENPGTPEMPPSQPSKPAPAVPGAPDHRADLLPSNCARCGAPVRSQDVKWTGPRSADCTYCGAHLEMKKD